MHNRCVKDMIQVCTAMYDRGLLVACDGNVSVRVGENRMIITGSGYCKGRLKPKDFSLVSMEGILLNGPKPARDIRMHLAAYRKSPDVNAIAHAHPPVTAGFSMTDWDASQLMLPEALFTLGDIACTRYCSPTTIEVPREVERVLCEKPNAKAILLAGHGALTMGTDIWDAFYKMETLELFLKATLVSKLVGGQRELTEEQMMIVQRLIAGENPDDVVKPCTKMMGGD